MVRRRGKVAGITTEVCNHTLTQHRHHRLPREWGHAGEGAPAAGACVEPHDPIFTTGARTALRSCRSLVFGGGSGDTQTHDAVLRIGSELRGGGPILNYGIEAMANTGPRHLEPSSATHRTRCGQA